MAGQGKAPKSRLSGVIAFVRRYPAWLLAPAAWLFGALAFQFAARAPGYTANPLDSAYRALQLFVLNLDTTGLAVSGDGSAAILDVPAIVLLAAILSALVTFGAGIALFAGAAWDRVRIWWQLRQRDRAVLLGFGTVNRAAARRLVAAGYRVTAVDQRFDDAARNLARSLGVVLVPGDLTDPSSLAPAHIDRTGRIVVAIGSDIANVELGTGLIRPGGPLVFIHVSDVQLAASLRQSGSGGIPFLRPAADGQPANGWVFSLKEESARNLLAEANLALTAREAGQQRVHLILVGVGDQGRAVLQEALLESAASGLAPPRFTLIDRDAEGLVASLSALMPRFFDGSIPEEARPSIDFIEADIGKLDVAASPELAMAEDADPPTAWVISCGEDATNLEFGLRLEQAMAQAARHPARLYLGLRNTDLSAGATQAAGRLSLVGAFGDVAGAIRQAPLLKTDPDQFAKGLNAEYNLQGKAMEEEFEGFKFYRREWEELSETLRESNRRAVRHTRTKLLDLDLRWKRAPDLDLPRVDNADAARLRAAGNALDYDHLVSDTGPALGAGDKPLLARAVLAEHRRWLVDRALDGWRPIDATRGESRDNDKRWHSNIVPFADLSITDKRYDVVMIRALLAHLASRAHTSGVVAAPRRAASLWLDGETTASVIPDGVTDLLLAWPAERSWDIPAAAKPAERRMAFRQPAADALVAAIAKWSLEPQAARLLVYLARPAATSAPAATISPAALLTRLATAVDAGIVLRLVPLYGRNVSQYDPGLDDTALEATLR